MKMFKNVLLMGATSVAALWGSTAQAAMPLPKEMGMQPPATEIARMGEWMHNSWLMPIITVITLFVLALLLWIIVRYRAAANPTPSKTSHNTLIEVIWTIVPVFILVAIAIPSFRLLYAEYTPPKADVTLKVTGHQWYWSYEYPDQGNFSFDSIMLTDEEAAKAKLPRLLATDNRVVVPAGKTVKLLITSADVMHSWAVPSFFVKMDAVPGRINEAWFKVEKPGIYYGQCSELCGIKHGFMPIMVEALEPAKFDAWVLEAKTKFASVPAPNQYAQADFIVRQ